MKCRGKGDFTVHEIFRVIYRFPPYISCYIAENRLPLVQCTSVYSSEIIRGKRRKISPHLRKQSAKMLTDV